MTACLVNNSKKEIYKWDFIYLLSNSQFDTDKMTEEITNKMAKEIADVFFFLNENFVFWNGSKQKSFWTDFLSSSNNNNKTNLTDEFFLVFFFQFIRCSSRVRPYCVCSSFTLLCIHFLSLFRTKKSNAWYQHVKERNPHDNVQVYIYTDWREWNGLCSLNRTFYI